MANKNSSASLALFLALNLMMFNLALSYSYRPIHTCPRDALKLSVCANVLNLVDLRVGEAQKRECCSLIGDLVKLNAAACLCTAVHVNLLNLVNLNLNVDLSLIVNNKCGYVLPSDFKCPPHA